MTVRCETRKIPNMGTGEVLIVAHEGEEHVLTTPCDEEGDDLTIDYDPETGAVFAVDDDGDAVTPYGYKLAETTYKGREDGGLIALIQRLAKHPEAAYQRYVDGDGDTVWRVFFRRPG